MKKRQGLAQFKKTIGNQLKIETKKKRPKNNINKFNLQK